MALLSHNEMAQTPGERVPSGTLSGGAHATLTAAERTQVHAEAEELTARMHGATAGTATDATPSQQSPATSGPSQQSADNDTHHVVFYACKYTPLELLAGFGAEAHLAEADVSSFDEADRLAHVNLCGYGKGLIVRLMQSDAHEAVLITCCDVIKRAYDVLKAQNKFDFLYLLDLPHKRGPREVALFRSRLADLAQKYADYSGRSFNVGAALAAFTPPVPRKDGQVTLAGAHATNAILKAVEHDVGFPVDNETCTNREVLVTPPPELARAAATGDCDACEVEDNARHEIPLSHPVVDRTDGRTTPGEKRTTPATSLTHPTVSRAGGTLDAFLDWYAEALLHQTPCMRMDDVEGRAKLLYQPKQRGVIYHTMKFCDYYGFEYADALNKENVPMVKIETDGTSQSAGQLRTRLEAFGETLRAGEVGRKRKALGRRGDAPSGQGPIQTPGTGGGAAQAQDRAGEDGSAASASGDAQATSSTDPTYAMGVDSGSTSTDAVIMDGERNIVAQVILPTGARATESARKAKEQVLEQAGLSEGDMSIKVATGYGRDNIPGMDTAITEITCHAKGAHYLAPQVRSVIDIGGQDSKVIHLSPEGDVVNFVMNDKCAAGTGRFMEAMARVLEMPLDEFCQEGLKWKHEVKISSMCTVFAESEVVSLVAEDTPTPDVIHGLDESVARKTATLAKRVSAEPPYLMTGGVAQNEGVVHALEDVLGAPVATHEDSQLCGAIGAALLGLDALA